MRPLFPRLSLRSPFGFSGAVLLAAGLLGACDRHSATEAPESYGHGSARNPSFDSHQIDSRPNSRSFSDTRGVDPDAKEGEGKAAPDASPSAAQPGRFFPEGSR